MRKPRKHGKHGVLADVWQSAAVLQCGARALQSGWGRGGANAPTLPRTRRALPVVSGTKVKKIASTFFSRNLF